MGSMRDMMAYLLVLLAVIDIAVSVYAVFYAPFPLIVPLGSPTAYINIYIHVPMAWSSYLLFTGALISAILFLWKGDRKFDRLVYSFAFTGIIYAVITTASGSVWAAESWGTPWNWDPRETGIIMLLLAYIVYFAIRSSISDPDVASRLSAVYAIAAYATVPLSFLAPSLVGGLHPTPRATGAFFSQPGVLPVFVTKIVLASLVALLLAYVFSQEMLQGRRVLAVGGAIVLIAGIVSGLILIHPYLVGSPERVYNATLSDGLITKLVLSGNRTIVFSNPVESPITPPYVQRDGELFPTITGHLVLVDNNSINIVVHWSVAANIILYAVLIGGLLLWAARRSSRKTI